MIPINQDAKLLEKSKGLEFIEAPEERTSACTAYMQRIIEIREFTSFLFSLINSSAEFTKELSAVQKKSTEEGRVEGKIINLTLVEYNYSKHRQLINEIMLSRAVESFDYYLQKMLELLFIARPELLKSEEKIDIATVIDIKNYSDILSYIAEKKINQLSYESLDKLRNYLNERTKVDLFPSEEDFQCVQIASEIRNLIAHNDCMVDQRFLKKINANADLIEIAPNGRVIISDINLKRFSYTLDKVVFYFDRQMSDKYSLSLEGKKTFNTQRG